MSFHPLPYELSSILQDAFPRAKRAVLHQFGLDVLALSVGLRTACLLDTVSVSQASASQLGRSLRELGWDALVVVFETRSEQAWVVNIEVLSRRVAAKDWPTFVEVGGASPAILQHPPEHLVSQLAHLLSSSPSRHLLLVDIPNETKLVQALVPLTAYLLEYPIAYTLDQSTGSNPSNCLGGRGLNVAQVWLGAKDCERHLLMSFSVPVALEQELPLAIDAMVERLRSTIEDRLHVARRQVVPILWDSVSAEISRGIVLDRVAL